MRRENRGDGCERATIGVILDIDGAIMRAMFSTTVRDFVNQKKKINAKKKINVTQSFTVAVAILKTNLWRCLGLIDFEPSLLHIKSKTTYPCAEVNIGLPLTKLLSRSLVYLNSGQSVLSLKWRVSKSLSFRLNFCVCFSVWTDFLNVPSLQPSPRCLLRPLSPSLPH